MEPSKNTSSQDTARERLVGAESALGEPTPRLSRDAKELASDVVDRAKDVASAQVSDQRERSASEIGKLANALHHTRDELGDTIAGPYVEKAADMLDRLSGSVRDGSMRDAVSATERFARREPLLFLGGAFVIGLLAARFLKSSERSESGQQSIQPTETL